MNNDVNQRKSLLEDLDHWAGVQADQPWLVEHWTTHQKEITWEKGAAMVHSAAAWIAERVQQSGTRIGTLSCNCAHWIMADLAIMASGNVHVPLFTTMKPENLDYVAGFAGIEMLLLGPADNWEQVRDRFPPDMPVILLPGAPEVRGAITWAEIVTAGASLPRVAAPDVNVLATIVFTSGTTGKPKGVMHSLSSLREAGSGIGFESGSQAGWRFLSYLPLAHLGERIVVECHSLVYGGTIYFNEGLATFLDDLRYARPNWFLGVPRIWEKLQQAVFANVLSAQELEAAKASGNLAEAGSKVKAFLGLGEIEYILTSTAPTPAPLKAWYDELGIELYDGYGQSEILPVSANRKGRRKPGSIGQAAHGVEIQIADNGEILARGQGTAMGYYRAPEITAETFLNDGWVRTGDKGHVDDDGYLFITGRVKEIFKTAKGKYVAPAPIEGLFLDTNLAEQACLSGLGLAQTVMMLVLSDAAIQRDEDNILAELLHHTAALNTNLDKHEQIGALIVSRTPWSHENGVLTHTLKIKRDQVEERFAEQIVLAGDRMRVGEPLFMITVP
jgi:long-chain acyl-CoA synthetase